MPSVATLSNSGLLNPTDHRSEQAAVVHSMPAEQRVHQARCSCLSAFKMGRFVQQCCPACLGASLSMQHPEDWHQQQVVSLVVSLLCHGDLISAGAAARLLVCWPGRVLLCTLRQAAGAGPPLSAIALCCAQCIRQHEQALSVTTLCCAILAQTSLQLRSSSIHHCQFSLVHCAVQNRSAGTFDTAAWHAANGNTHAHRKAAPYK